MLTGSGLILPTRVGTEALASEIPRRLVRAAVELHGYRATFDIQERDWTRAVPGRSFVADIAFRAPEYLRVRVTDTTSYPSAAWPRNDLLLQTDGRNWRASGPDPCPAPALPACPGDGPVVRTIRGRPPFDSQTSMPTDIIVPMTVLAAADRVDLVGSGEVAGRAAVAVELAYGDATPLFQYLRFLGSWRPFFPQDRVVIWLDRSTWFPLRYEVLPAPGQDRAQWAAQQGLPREEPGQPVFEATARRLVRSVPPLRLFSPRTGPDANDEGFRDEPLSPLGSGAGSAPVRPRWTAGLRPWRYGTFDRTAARLYDESVLAYSRGLSLLTVTRVAGWSRRSLFGVGAFAEPVLLPSGHGVGYYEPATAIEPRRISLHTMVGEFLVVSNLPRATLLEVAGSLPVTGLPQPATWRIHRWSGGVVEQGLSPSEALRRAPFTALVPGSMPVGYRPAAAEVVRSRGVLGIAIDYRRPAAELGGTGFRLYQAVGQGLPPPNGPEVEVLVRGVEARWSPDDGLLEWTEGRIYRSLSAPGLDLSSLVRVANSLHPAAATGSS
jgi:hypothetical protein